MSNEKKRLRFWGIFIFSVLYTLFSMASGSRASAIQILWIWVAYYAYTGNARAIATTAKSALVVQILVGAALFVFLPAETFAYSNWSSREIFAISVGIPTIFWVILYFRAKSLIDITNSSQLDALSDLDMSIGNAPMNANRKVRAKSNEHTSGELANKGGRHSLISEARIHFSYNPAAKRAFDSLQNMPDDFKLKFIEFLVRSPNSPIDEILRISFSEALGIKHEDWTSELDQIRTELLSSAPEVSQEFCSVFPTLSKSMSLNEIMLKVKARVAGPVKRTVSMVDRNSVSTLCHVHENGMLTLPLFNRTFSKLDDVYTFLGTPSRKRRPLYDYASVRKK